MKRIIITLCICTAWVASTYAQYPYTLKKCLEEGLANNYSIRITRNEEQISHNNATLANAGYLPTVDLSAGYTGTLDNTIRIPRVEVQALQPVNETSTTKP